MRRRFQHPLQKQGQSSSAQTNFYSSGGSSSDEVLTDDMEAVKVKLLTDWVACADLQTRELNVQGTTVFVAWLQGLVNKQLIHDGIIEPLMEHMGSKPTGLDVQNIIQTPTLTLQTRFSELNSAIADGKTVIVVQGWVEAIVVDTGQTAGRSVDKAELEPSVQGPQEGFTENLETSIALIRRKVRTHKLKVVMRKIGSMSHTPVVVIYLDGVTKPEIVNELYARLDKIQADSILDINYIAEFINDAPFSPYPTHQSSERPDRVAAALLQGRLAVMIDGSPYALLVPTLFVHLLSAVEDYYGSSLITLPLRMLRHIAYWGSILMPAIYVALASFHQDLVPTPLLIRFSTSREGIPFPSVVEALVMMGSFEALREAGIRLPRAMGQSVSIVGALVIGDAAVRAGIVSPAMVIVVALSGILSFTIASYNLSNTNRVLQFMFLFASGVFGLYGIVVFGLVLIVHLVSLRSLGVPYLAPAAPFKWKDMRDILIRVPWWAMSARPDVLESPNEVRNQTALPSPRR